MASLRLALALALLLDSGRAGGAAWSGGGTFNVLHYGAKADGITYDTAVSVFKPLCRPHRAG